MKILRAKVDEVVILELDVPRLGRTHVHELRNEIQERLLKGTKLLVIDLERVEHIAREAVGVLLATAEKLRTVQGRCVLCSLHEEVRLAFEVAGFFESFEVAEDRSVVEDLLVEKARRLSDPIRAALGKDPRAAPWWPDLRRLAEAATSREPEDPEGLEALVRETGEILASLPEFQIELGDELNELEQLAVAGGMGKQDVPPLLGVAQRWFQDLLGRS